MTDLTVQDLYRSPSEDDKKDSVWVEISPPQETAREEIERLNPHFRWNWRKVKKIINWRAKQLIPNVTYALGCRGHPGLVIERCWDPTWPHQSLYGADVSIKSLIDGVEESCSIWHCAPQAISKQEAEERAEEIRTMHDVDIAIKHGHTVEAAREWIQDWVDRGVLYYVLHDQEGYTVRSSQAFTKRDAEADVARHERLIAGGKYFGNITNPRMVDMLTYPAPIKSFEVEVPT